MNVVYASATNGPHDRRFLEAISDLGCKVVHLQITQDASQGPGHFVAWGATALASIWKTLSESFHPDLVHAGPIQEVAFPLMEVVDVPLIPMSWGSDLLLPQSSDHLWSYAAESVLTRSEVLFADCQAVDQAARRIGFEGVTVSFPWGVDIQQFVPPPVTRVGNDATFISVRNWHPIYNVGIVIRAFSQMAEHYPGSKLLLAGSGPLSSQIHEEISNIRCGHVEVLGKLNVDELIVQLQSADIYVSASLSDGSSISLLEAMACGLAPIVSDIPGNREWVTESDNGWLFPPTDIKHLADVMAQAAADLKESRCIGEKNIEIVRSRADWRRNNALLLEGYRMVVS